MKLRGFQNLGNSCYLNSTIQCLLNTPLIKDHLLTRDHSNTCYDGEKCVYCMIEDLCVAYSMAKGVIAPRTLVKNVRRVGKNFRAGRQEDAHEFLVKLMEIMTNKKGASFIEDVFGGRLHSQVTCEECSYKSVTVDKFMNISLSIGDASTLTECFQLYTSIEELERQGSGYKCDKCEKAVEASKVITIDRAPQVLVIHLKRFDFTENHGAKVTKQVDFPEYLDISAFMKGNARAPHYMLYGVIVHYGRSTESGHYYAFIRSQENKWYLLDDDAVEEVLLSQVLEDQAYILFYIDEGKFDFRDLEIVNSDDEEDYDEEKADLERKAAKLARKRQEKLEKGEDSDPDEKAKKKKNNDPDKKGVASLFKSPKKLSMDDITIKQKITQISEKKKDEDDEDRITCFERFEFFYDDILEFFEKLGPRLKSQGTRFWIVDICLPFLLLCCCCVVCCLVFVAIVLTIVTSVLSG